MRIVSKSSQNHSYLSDLEWRISFLSDMRCVIRPQNYSFREPMNLAICLKRYFQRNRVEKNFEERWQILQECSERIIAKYVRLVLDLRLSCCTFMNAFNERLEIEGSKSNQVNSIGTYIFDKSESRLLNSTLLNGLN